MTAAVFSYRGAENGMFFRLFHVFQYFTKLQLPDKAMEVWWNGTAIRPAEATNWYNIAAVLYNRGTCICAHSVCIDFAQLCLSTNCPLENTGASL